jgi:hypothetical protein
MTPEFADELAKRLGFVHPHCEGLTMPCVDGDCDCLAEYRRVVAEMAAEPDPDISEERTP